MAGLNIGDVILEPLDRLGGHRGWEYLGVMPAHLALSWLRDEAPHAIIGANRETVKQLTDPSKLYKLLLPSRLRKLLPIKLLPCKVIPKVSIVIAGKHGCSNYLSLYFACGLWHLLRKSFEAE